MHEPIIFRKLAAVGPSDPQRVWPASRVWSSTPYTFEQHDLAGFLSHADSQNGSSVRNFRYLNRLVVFVHFALFGLPSLGSYCCHVALDLISESSGTSLGFSAGGRGDYEDTQCSTGWHGLDRKPLAY